MEWVSQDSPRAAGETAAASSPGIEETMTSTMAPTGRLTKNIQRQPVRSVRTPPRVGPASEAAPKVMENQPY